eukprot:4768894-Pyramimonas_sp.AAC.1
MYVIHPQEDFWVNMTRYAKYAVTVVFGVPPFFVFLPNPADTRSIQPCNAKTRLYMHRLADDTSHHNEWHRPGPRCLRWIGKG